MSPLDEIREKLERQMVKLSEARNKYLSLEAERKHLEATLTKAALGKSQAEKLMNAQAMGEWLEFHKTLARAEAVFEFQKLKFEVLDKEWLAQYAEMKSDQQMINRQSSGPWRKQNA